MKQQPLTAVEAAHLVRFWHAVEVNYGRLLTARWTFDPACAACHGGGIAAEYDWTTGRGWVCRCGTEAPDAQR